MSEGLRWTLILGCLLLATLEAPESSLVLVQDLQGPWRAGRDARDRASTLAEEAVPSRAAGTISFAALKPEGADASVAPEDAFGLDRYLPPRRADKLATRNVAILIAR